MRRERTAQPSPRQGGTREGGLGESSSVTLPQEHIDEEEDEQCWDRSRVSRQQRTQHPPALLTASTEKKKNYLNHTDFTAGSAWMPIHWHTNTASHQLRDRTRRRLNQYDVRRMKVLAGALQCLCPYAERCKSSGARNSRQTSDGKNSVRHVAHFFLILVPSTEIQGRPTMR